MGTLVYFYEEVISERQNIASSLNYEVISEEVVNTIASGVYDEGLSDRIEKGVLALEPDLDVKDYLDSFYYFYDGITLDNLRSKTGARKAGNDNEPRRIRRRIRDCNTLNQVKHFEVRADDPAVDRSWFFCAIKVGRGDCTLIRTPMDRYYLFDAGDKNKQAFRKVSNLFGQLDILAKRTAPERLSGIFISHPDNDHFMGIPDILDNVRMAPNALIYYNYLSHLGANNWANVLNKITQEISTGNLTLVPIPNQRSLGLQKGLIPSMDSSFFWPHNSLNFNPSRKPRIVKNDTSHVILLGNKNSGFQANICGDAEKLAWDNSFGIFDSQPFGCFLFKYSHHGRNSGNRAIPLGHPNGTRINDYFSHKSSEKVISSHTVAGHRFCPTGGTAHLTERARQDALIFEMSTSGITVHP